MSYRGIYLLDTLTKLFEGLIGTRLAKFTELNDILSPYQLASRITRQIHDAIYALIIICHTRAIPIRIRQLLLLH